MLFCGRDTCYGDGIRCAVYDYLLHGYGRKIGGGYMYIHGFIDGILVTVVLGMAVLIAVAIVGARKKK